ncbi:MAG: hypothetical protein ACK56F_03660, partial [bacterium]
MSGFTITASRSSSEAPAASIASTRSSRRWRLETLTRMASARSGAGPIEETVTSKLRPCARNRFSCVRRPVAGSRRHSRAASANLRSVSGSCDTSRPLIHRISPEAST